jgi:hypothetical protein
VRTVDRETGWNVERYDAMRCDGLRTGMEGGMDSRWCSDRTPREKLEDIPRALKTRRNTHVSLYKPFRMVISRLKLEISLA